MDRLLKLLPSLPERNSIIRSQVFFVLTAPVIYSLIIPALFMDFFVRIYQAICFPVYGIPKVNRDDYIKHDRHKLSYLTSVQKVNCAYCAYFNGLIAFVREVAGRTEQYWCPIKHAMPPKDRHPRYEKFSAYGESKKLEQEWQRNRDDFAS